MEIALSSLVLHVQVKKHAVGLSTSALVQNIYILVMQLFIISEKKEKHFPVFQNMMSVLILADTLMSE